MVFALALLAGMTCVTSARAGAVDAPSHEDAAKPPLACSAPWAYSDNANSRTTECVNWAKQIARKDAALALLTVGDLYARLQVADCEPPLDLLKPAWSDWRERTRAFFEEHEAAFRYAEIVDCYAYNRVQLKKLEERFPNDHAAPVAAWVDATLPEIYECEGFVECILRRDVRPFVEFVRKYPHSSHVSEAVQGVRKILGQEPPARQRPEDEERETVASVLDAWAKAIQPLSPSLRAPASVDLAVWWAWLGNSARARTDLEYAVKNGDVRTSERARQVLEHLGGPPAR